MTAKKRINKILWKTLNMCLPHILIPIKGKAKLPNLDHKNLVVRQPLKIATNCRRNYEDFYCEK